MLDTKPLLLQTDFPGIRRNRLTTLQVNLGYLCNLSCVHCHVNAGPSRQEQMSREVIDDLLLFMRHQAIDTLDLTGGAPEMNPHFRYLVREARADGIRVIDRCNLSILLEPGYEDLASFLAENRVEIAASLPCYTDENVSKQRGKGVFDQSIEALLRLNELGYGRNKELILNLVYNPLGAHLPPPQQALQQDYQRILKEQHGVVFNELLTITNMPISRFGSVLLSQGQFDAYMQLLKESYSAANLSTLMCKSLISVDWQGYVYDCDFNQMLTMPLIHSGINDVIASDASMRHIRDLVKLDFYGQAIVVADHCWACTAGQGSSCSGALSEH
jgi:radical SAM/Cys-rich protein